MKQKWTTSLIALLAAFSLLSAGCYSTHRVAPAELQKLDGYETRGEKRELVSEDGKRFKFHSDVLLSLYLLGDPEPYSAEYDAVQVDAEKFVGDTDDGQRVRFDLAEIQSAEAEYFDSKRTGALVAIVTMVTLTAGVVLLLSTLEVRGD